MKRLLTILAGLIFSAFSLQPPVLLRAQSSAPGSLTFPAGVVGVAESGTLTSTFTNTSSVTITSISVAVTGGQSGDFSVTTVPATNCGGSLTSGSTCTLTVTFTPGALGSRASTVSISWAGNAFSPFTIFLAGFGTQGGPPAGTAIQAIHAAFALPYVAPLSTTATQAYTQGVIVQGATSTNIPAGTVTLSGGALSNCAPPAYSSCGFIYWPGSGTTLSFSTSFLTADAPGNVIVAALTTNASNIPLVITPWPTNGLPSPFGFEMSTGAITPTATAAAIGVATQTFTVTGLALGDFVAPLSLPTPTALCPPVGFRATALNTLSIDFAVMTAVACTPAAGTYKILVVR